MMDLHKTVVTLVFTQFVVCNAVRKACTVNRFVNICGSVFDTQLGTQPTLFPKKSLYKAILKFFFLYFTQKNLSPGIHLSGI